MAATMDAMAKVIEHYGTGDLTVKLAAALRPPLMSKPGCKQNDGVLSLNAKAGRLAVEFPPRSGNAVERSRCNWLCRACLGRSPFRWCPITCNGQFAFAPPHPSRTPISPPHPCP